MRFLHLNDNSKYVKKGEPGFDPLFKLRPFIDSLLKNFQDAYHPARELSIDESMIGFKGRLSFIQYLPKKPTKWGMKAFVLADSKTGYTYNWRLYTGTLIQQRCKCILMHIESDMCILNTNYTHTHTHTHMHTHICILTHTHTHAMCTEYKLYTHTLTCTHIQAYSYIHTHTMCVYDRKLYTHNIYTYTHSLTCTRTHTLTYTHMHTNFHTLYTLRQRYFPGSR